MKLYVEYVNNFDNATARLKDMLANPAVPAFFNVSIKKQRELSAHPFGTTFPIRDYFPMGRMEIFCGGIRPIVK